MKGEIFIFCVKDLLNKVKTFGVNFLFLVSMNSAIEKGIFSLSVSRGLMMRAPTFLPQRTRSEYTQSGTEKCKMLVMKSEPMYNVAINLYLRRITH